MRSSLHRSLIICAVAAAVACTTDTAIGPDTIASLFISPDSADVVLGATRQLTAVAHDSSGVPFVGVPATWASGDAGVATVSPTGLVTAVALGTTTITANAKSLSDTATIVVVPPPTIALSAPTVSFNAIANGPDPAAQTVSVTNGGGATLAGLTVDTIIYTVGAAGWLAAALDLPAAPATLTLTVATGSLAVGSYTATVRIASPVAVNSPQDVTVTFTVAVGAPTEMAVSAGDGQTAPVNTAVSTAPAVLVRDQYGNPVPGVSVTFTVPGGGGGGGVTGATPVTGANGVATVGSWTLGTAAGPNSLDATSPGLSTVTFTATGVAGPATQIAVGGGNGQSATVNTSVAVPPAALVRDQFNNPVAGVAVSFAVASGGGSITGAAATSDANGLARVGSWTLGTVAGANTITATAAGLTGSPVTFTATGTPAAATQIALNAGDGQTATVNTVVATAPSVVVRDQYGNGVSGVGVAFAVTGGGGSVTGGSTTTNASGIAQPGSWRLGTAAGANSLSATSAGLGGSPVAFTATGVAGPAAQVAVNDGNNQGAQVGTTVPTPPSVLVGDQFNNPVAGVTVTFAIISGGGSITGASATSDAGGIARVGSWTLGTSAGTNTLDATAPGLTGSPVTFTATGFAGTATTLTYDAGDAQTDTAGATLAVAYRVRVTDANANGVQGVPVGWAVTGGGGSISPPTVNSDVNGFATAVRTLGTATGSQTATASVGGLTGSPITFTATATAATATQIAAAAGDGQTAPVNTAVATAPAVVVRDQFGNPVPGVSVTFTVTGGGGAVNPTTAITTDVNGVAQLTSWTLGTVAGTNNNTLSATSPGLSGSPVPFTASATPGPVSGGQSTVAASPTPITACQISCTTGGGTASTITVTVRDQFGNLISGAPVTVGSNGSNNYFNTVLQNSVSGTSNLSGVFTATFNSGTAQTKTISATANSVSITASASVVVNPGPPNATFSSLVESNDPITACQASCTTGGGTASTLTVTARDAFNNIISGASVTVSVTAGTNNYLGGVLQNSVTSTTNGSGVYAVNYNSGVAALKSFDAAITASATTINETTSLTVNPAAAAQLAITTQPAGATSNVDFTTQPVVQLRDQFGNDVSQSLVSVTAAVFSGTGTLGGTATASTNASGQAVFSTLRITGTLTGVGNHSLRFTSGVLTAATSGTFLVATSFSYNVGFIFANNGCNGCHGALMAWANLVNRSSVNCPGETYVIPSNAAGSFLQKKVDFTQACGSGMPTGGIMPLSTRDIIRSWINQGALNN